jgi:predicted permease
MTSFLQDLRYGFRLLGRNPGFTAVAALVLALGIGANTAMFTLVNALVLKPRPGAPDEALAGVYSRDRTAPDAYRAFSYPNYADLRERGIFASLAGHTFALAGMREGDALRRVFVDVTTANFFDTFGVPLLLGRTFSADEERPGADIPVTVLSFKTWQRLGGRPDVLGTHVRLNERDFAVIGVAAKGFGGSMSLVSPELWVPTGVYDTLSNDFIRDGLPATLGDRRHHALILVARLRDGDTMEGLAPRLDAAGRDLERAFPGENARQALTMARLPRMSVSTSPQDDSELGTLSVLLFSMSGLVLLVASLNLANMLLARGAARQKEFAIRLAIGGSRWRVARQLLTESLALSIVGGAVATFVAWGGTHLLVSSLSPKLPVALSLETAPDLSVLAATIAFCVVSSVFFGLAPAWRHARTDALPELKAYAGEASGRRSRLAMRHALVMAQLALSLVTLTAAGMFVRAALESAQADPGFTFERGIMANVDPSLAGRSRSETMQFYERALARVRQLPGVESASVGSIMPFGEFTEGRAVQKAGAPIRRGEASSSMTLGAGGEASDEIEPGLIDAVTTSIGADYFRTLGVAVTRGREFTAAEELAPSDARIAIIDEPLAQALFGQGNPVGELVQYSVRDSGEIVQLRVVGVAGPVRHQLLERRMRPHLYTPLGQDFRASVFLHVRTAAPTADAETAMLPAIRRELMALDPAAPILSLETRPMYRDRNFVLWTLRAGANTFLTFGVMALFMAAIGVYGVKSYLVARRTREIGVRIALGATPRGVVRMVLRDGAVLAASGIVGGIALSAAAGGLIRNLLFGDGRFDAAVIGGAGLVLVAAVLAASGIPAWRATRIAPTRALRSE